MVTTVQAGGALEAQLDHGLKSLAQAHGRGCHLAGSTWRDKLTKAGTNLFTGKADSRPQSGIDY